jgi:hypothetical protein
MKLYLENVRSFEGWHEIPIAPATILLGENSAGKSTLLGMLAVVHNEGFPFGGNFFNQFPFEFGGYKTLANSKKSVKHFSVGLQTQISTRYVPPRARNQKFVSTGLVVAFRDDGGLPVPCHVFVWMDDLAVSLCELGFKHINRLTQLGLPASLKIDTMPSPNPSPQGITLLDWRRAWYEQRKKNDHSSRDQRHYSDEFDFRMHVLNGGGMMGRGRQSAMAFAPMRSRPKRTYDQLSDEFSPEGDHVPLLLARATDPSNKQAKALHDALRDFGSYSEMFTDIGVKQLGRGSGDPFQVQVKEGTKSTNLMDVGYGVSQILPLIVDAQRAGNDTTLLLQQPEVHLHPKAQAALGSMIKDWVSKNQKTVVVETHSDYLVDRLRLEVKKAHLKATDVKIFFLEKKKGQTTVHILEVDAEGNVLNAPEGYRDFFMLEQMALLGD